MNNVVLIGRLTKNPESGFTPQGMAVTKFTLAVDRRKEGTDFIRITTWGKTAENVARYMTKGRQVAIHGRIQTGSYKDNGRTIFTTDVIADNVEFLGKSESTESDFGNDGFMSVDDGVPF